MTPSNLTYAQCHTLAQKAATLSESAFRHLDKPEPERLERAYADLIAVMWQPIGTAPKDSEILLCELYDDGSYKTVVGSWSDGEWRSGEPFPHQPTHWARIEPPRT